MAARKTRTPKAAEAPETEDLPGIPGTAPEESPRERLRATILTGNHIKVGGMDSPGQGTNIENFGLLIARNNGGPQPSTEEPYNHDHGWSNHWATIIDIVKAVVDAAT